MLRAHAPLLAAALLVFCGGCRAGSDSSSAVAPEAARPALQTTADSLAWRITEAAGGPDAWAALPVLRFDFVVEREGAEVFRARHLWDRATGRYRVEWPAGEDSTFVALFTIDGSDTAEPVGRVFLDGRSAGSALGRELTGEAYERHVNDTYWLLAPLKLFDGGVRRALAPDSSDGATDVLALSFDGVGMTPGDRYWLRADRATGRLAGWSFVLQDSSAGRYDWSDEATLATPAGPLRLATRKATPGGTSAILTPVFPAPPLTDSLFTDALPRLGS